MAWTNRGAAELTSGSLREAVAKIEPLAAEIRAIDAQIEARLAKLPMERVERAALALPVEQSPSIFSAPCPTWLASLRRRNEEAEARLLTLRAILGEELHARALAWIQHAPSIERTERAVARLLAGETLDEEGRWTSSGRVVMADDDAERAANRLARATGVWHAPEDIRALGRPR